MSRSSSFGALAKPPRPSRPARSSPPAPAELPTVVEEPRQLRSLAVLDQIVEAGRSLLAEREFEAISIADIARQAGVSVGVFYTRFATKEHLLAHLARELSITLQEQVQRAMSAERIAGLSMVEIAESYFALAVQSFIKHRSVLRPLSLIVRLEAHRELRELVSVFNASAHAQFHAALMTHRAEIQHADPDWAVDFAILSASAAVREVVLYGNPVSQSPRQRQRIVGDAARLCVAYLTFASVST